MSNNNTNNKQLKVLVITSTYPRYETDYAVPWMRETHRRLSAEGHEITVLAPSFKGLKSHLMDGIEVVRFRYAPRCVETLTHEEGATHKVRKPWMQLLAIPYIIVGCLVAAWLACTRRFDAVHVHWPFPHGLMGQVASLLNRAPMVVMSHGAEFALARRKKWVAPFLRQSLRAADLCVANSSDTASRVEALSGRECAVLPYGSTVVSIPAPAIEKEKPRVLFTGRLIERKGIEYLLQAVPMILAEHDVQFVITGNGDQRDRLVALRDELGLQQSVTFAGFLSKEDLQTEYSLCDVWVNPGIVDSWGDAEGLGVGSIEAYNYCKPVIASAVGGIPDTVIDGETGYLVPEKNSETLADAICDLLSDPAKAKRFGRNGYRFAERTFSWESIIPRMEDLYRLAAAPYKLGGMQEPITA